MRTRDPGYACRTSTGQASRTSLGLLLPTLSLVMTALLIPAIALYMQMVDTGTDNLSRDRAIAQQRLLTQAEQSVWALAAIKGFSRPEELGALTCPDTTADRMPDFCGSELVPLSTGNLPDMTRLGPGLLGLAPGSGNLSQRTLFLSIDPRSADGSDQTMTPALNNDALILRTAWDEDAPIRRSRSDQTTVAQSRLKAAFLAHVHLAARNQGNTLSVRWAFEETLHLAHEANSAGTRFKPVNSGCQCNCTRTRCKCACLQTSEWETRGNCVSASDAGTCSAYTGPHGRVTRCTAPPGRYCYLDGESGLASRWPVSLYTPRASEGRACRPERNDTCSLTSKNGSSCTCQFDWPKPVSPERLDRLRLTFSNSQPGNAANASLLP